MDAVDKVISAIIGGIFLVAFVVIMIFQIQMRINSRTISVVSLRQKYQMNNIKSKIDQGYYREAEDYMRETNHEISQASTRELNSGFYNTGDNEVVTSEGYGWEQGVGDNNSGGANSYNAIEPVPPLGMPTRDDSFAYGQAYAIRNRQGFTWKTIFTGGTRINLVQGATGVNRGHFSGGYVYRGRDEHIERDLQGEGITDRNENVGRGNN